MSGTADVARTVAARAYRPAAARTRWWWCPVPAVRRLLLVLALLGAGIGLAHALPMVDPSSPGFFLLATALLAVGLFAGTSGIPRLARSDLRIVLLAVSVGVLVKAALIAGVMMLAFRDPAYLILGAVMAQIDPLSVTALQSSSRLSERGQAVLTAWSAFDDPVTSVLVLLLAAVASRLSATAPGAGGAAALLSPVSGIVGSLVLVAVAAAIWYSTRWWLRARRGPDAATEQEPLGFTVVSSGILLGLAVLAVHRFWMFGLAATGLFYRPRIGPVLRVLAGAAFAVATVVLGAVAADGVSVLPGVVLGVTAFGAQALVAVVVTASLPRTDRIRLAFGQQSGITAIILSLLVEPVVPGTIAVAAPAILTVNALYLVSNVVLDRIQDRRHQSGGVASTTART